MRHGVLTFLPILLLSVFAILPGCAGKPPAAPPVSQTKAMQEIAELYKFIAYERRPAPKKLSDLADYQDSLGDAWPGLQSGEVVINWGAGLSKTGEAGQTLLAYSRDAATESGAILLCDGTVKEVSAQEFKSLQKRRP
jgi:hypothetical protein